MLSACNLTQVDNAKKNNPKYAEYDCEGDASVRVVYENQDKIAISANIDQQEKHWSMQRVPSASGEKYSDGDVTWWSKGKSGMLLRGDENPLSKCNQLNAAGA